MDIATRSHAARLQQLERYLQQDPHNGQLLADTFDTALAAGAHGRAQACVQAAREMQLDPAQWGFRSAQLALAQHRWRDALQALDRVQALSGEHPGIVHDMAFVYFRTGQLAQARALVSPWLAAGRIPDPQTLAAMQVLWLRATHQLGLLDEAWAWAGAQARGHTLAPLAAGVASLVAIDLGSFEDAGTFADCALGAGALSPEALVARASVALAQRDAPLAQGLLQQALALNPQDGRTWSTLGMAGLLAQDLGQARAHFEKAVACIPEHIGTWHGLGWARLLQQDLPAALDSFERGLALDRNFAESHGGVALVLVLSGRDEEAGHHLELADRLDRHNVTARYARALRGGKLRDLQAVRALARRLLDRPGLFGGRLSDSIPAPE